MIFARGDCGLWSEAILREYMADARPEPYEKRTTLLPARSSGLELGKRNGAKRTDHKTDGEERSSTSGLLFSRVSETTAFKFPNLL